MGLSRVPFFGGFFAQVTSMPTYAYTDDVCFSLCLSHSLSRFLRCDCGHKAPMDMYVRVHLDDT